MTKHGNTHAHDDQALQQGLVDMQVAAAASGDRAVIVLEGRDTAGKDGTIKAITQHLSIRSTRVVALPKPTDREHGQWYLQRYVAQLPAAGELVIFNRSWYNRAGVEVVNGFSTAAEQAQFLKDVPEFERMLVESGIKLVKLWLDIDKKEQRKRLEARHADPLKKLKVSPLDEVAPGEVGRVYRRARHDADTDPYADRAVDLRKGGHKNKAHRAVVQHLLRTLAPATIANGVKAPSAKLLFPFEPAALEDGRLAR